MSYTLYATLMARLDVREVVDSTTSPASADGGNERTFNQYSLDGRLYASSYPPIAGAVVDLSFTLVSTTKDFDLTAAPVARDKNVTVDKTGFKLVGMILRFAKGNNASGVTFGPQGGNGYALFGASKTPIFYPGDEVLICSYNPDQDAALTINRPAVGASAKDLRFSGAASDAWKCLMIFNG